MGLIDTVNFQAMSHRRWPKNSIELHRGNPGAICSSRNRTPGFSPARIASPTPGGYPEPVTRCIDNSDYGPSRDGYDGRLYRLDAVAFSVDIRIAFGLDRHFISVLFDLKSCDILIFVFSQRDLKHKKMREVSL